MPGGTTSKNSSSADDLYVNSTLQRQFMLYPNPATSGMVSLKLNEAVSGKFTVKITTMSGRQVYQKSFESFGKSDQISINGLSLQNGSYIVSVVGSKVNWSNTLFVER